MNNSELVVSSYMSNFKHHHHVVVEDPWVRGRSPLFTALFISRCERRIGWWMGCPLRSGMRLIKFAIIFCVLRPHHFPITSTKRARGRPRPREQPVGMLPSSATLSELWRTKWANHCACLIMIESAEKHHLSPIRSYS